MNILDLDATALSENFKSESITSTEIVNTYIQHITNINPVINAMVQDRFQQARVEALNADKALKQNVSLGRLHGIPISMKECFDVVGMSTTGGLIHRKDELSTDDATIVKRLRDEGAIILGKTNTPTLCFCQETDNKLYGRTNNPWDLHRTAGGSSGGEGALIAAGGAAVGIGSDIGGSIRFPAHCNGVVGFKSGKHQVDDSGSYPSFPHPLQRRMLGIGALAKSVRDARLIHDILAEQKTELQVLSDFSITFPYEQLYYPVSSQTKALLLTLFQFLQKHMMVVDEQPPLYQKSALLWQLIMSIDGASSISKEAFPHSSALAQYVKEKLTKNSDYHSYLTWAIIGANLFKPSKQKLTEVEQQIKSGDELISSYLHKRLLILPVYHSAAPKHGKLYAEIFSIRKTFLRYMPFVAYANVWGLPSLTVPIGEEEGMPIGIQIISISGNEDAIFQLGEIIENQFRGWKRAPIE